MKKIYSELLCRALKELYDNDTADYLSYLETILDEIKNDKDKDEIEMWELKGRIEKLIEQIKN